MQTRISNGVSGCGPDFKLSRPDTIAHRSVELPPALSVIVELKQQGGIWIPREVASFSRGTGDANPATTPDGRRFYFTSLRSVDGGSKPAQPPNPWVMARAGDGWALPRQVNIPIGDNQYIMNVLPAGDDTLYLTLREGQKETVCLSRLQDGTCQVPQSLGDEVNSVRFQVAGYVAPDESYLPLSAFDAAGSQGGSDLYVSFRRPDGTRGAPINLGPAVNTSDNEFSPSPTLS